MTTGEISVNLALPFGGIERTTERCPARGCQFNGAADATSPHRQPIKKIGTMNRSCRRLPRRSAAKTGEPAGEAGFARRIHGFTAVATNPGSREGGFVTNASILALIDSRGRWTTDLILCNTRVARHAKPRRVKQSANSWRSEHCQESWEGEGASDLDKRNAAVKLRGSDWQRKQETRNCGRR